jgi:hypothetical protein
VEREEIVEALTSLGAVLDSRGLRGEMYVVGGAAIALAFDERRSTRDVDAIFEPKMEIYAAASEVAERLGLPPGWLNDAVKGFRACAASPPPRGSSSRSRCWRIGSARTRAMSGSSPGRSS